MQKNGFGRMNFEQISGLAFHGSTGLDKSCHQWYHNKVAARERSSSGDTTPEKSIVYGHMKILWKFGRAVRAENFREKISKTP